VLKDGRAKKNGWNLGGMQRRDFRDHDQRLRDDYFDRRISLLVLTRGNQGDRAFMTRSRCVVVKAFMQLRRN